MAANGGHYSKNWGDFLPSHCDPFFTRVFGCATPGNTNTTPTLRGNATWLAECTVTVHSFLDVFRGFMSCTLSTFKQDYEIGNQYDLKWFHWGMKTLQLQLFDHTFAVTVASGIIARSIGLTNGNKGVSCWPIAASAYQKSLTNAHKCIMNTEHWLKFNLNKLGLDTWTRKLTSIKHYLYMRTLANFGWCPNPSLCVQRCRPSGQLLSHL